MHWGVYPFFRILIAFAGGILINQFLAVPDNIISFLILFILVLFGFIWLYPRFAKQYEARQTQGILIFISFLCLGFISTEFKYSSQVSGLDASNHQNATHFTATLLSNQAQTEKTYKYKVMVDRVRIDNQWRGFSYKAILYFVSDSTQGYRYGDKVLVKGALDYFQKQTNPYAFDYAKFMGFQGVHLQSFVKSEDCIALGSKSNFSLKLLSFSLGDYLEDKLSAYIDSEQELVTIKAMLLGRRDEVTSEMENVYQSTGTSHILAVSGLHVGIVFLLFSIIFGWLKTGRLRWLYYLLVLLGIWSFAFLTGSSPSVMRASLMLTIVLLAEFSSRKSSIYNSIFLSAFLLLLFDPYLLFSVSFQLSYAAVLGIVYLYQRIYALVFLRSSILNFLWKITAVSLSVQIITFPITLFYFHQFPLVFPVTNLIAIPTATIVIVGSLALLLTSYLFAIPDVIAFVLEKWVYFYNESMTYFSEMKFASISGIYFEYYYVFLLMAMVVLLLKFLESKQLIFMKIFTVALSFTVIISTLNLCRKANQKMVVFYDTGNSAYVDIFLGTTCYSNLVWPEDTSFAARYNIIPNRKYNSFAQVKPIQDLEALRTMEKNSLIRIGDKSIFFVEELGNLALGNDDIIIDYIVLNVRSSDFIGHLDDYINYRNIILDGSIQSTKATKIEELALKSATIHSVSKDGAFVINL